eukprot:scaffold7374_cov65-Skeletonema_dohrnii-CCMP3373.AAC.1
MERIERISCIARSSAVMVGGLGIHGHDGYGFMVDVDVDDGMENYQIVTGVLGRQKRVPGGQEKVPGGKKASAAVSDQYVLNASLLLV